MRSPTVSVVLSAGRREDFQLWPRQECGLAYPQKHKAHCMGQICVYLVLMSHIPLSAVCQCHEQCLLAIHRDTGLDIASLKEMFATDFSSPLGTGHSCPCISTYIPVCRNSCMRACTSPPILAQHFDIHSSMQRWH